MFDDFLEKINFEYDTFYNFLMASERCEIVNLAFNIAFKKAVYKRLFDEARLGLDKDLFSKGLIIDGFADYICSKAKDKSLFILDQDGNLSSQNWESIKENL